MAFKLTIAEPSTVYLKNLSSCNRVNIYLQGLQLPYFFRELDCKYNCIKVNLPHVGTYSGDNGEIESVCPIEIEPLNIKLPYPDRDRMKQFIIKHNPLLTGSPARNFTQTGIIETGTRYKTAPFPIRLFILLHEIGHFLYKNEDNCDAWAAKQFIAMGYNNSTAIYALTKVLNCESPTNKQRILKLFNHLKK